MARDIADADRQVPARQAGALRKAAEFSHRHNLLGLAYILCLAATFLVHRPSAQSFVFFYLVLPLAALGLLSPARRKMSNSLVLWACALYLAALALSAFMQPETDSWWAPGQAWRLSRHAAITFLFVLVTASLVAAYEKFLPRLLLFGGALLALSALINIYLYYSALHPGLQLNELRLKATIGMPGYENSTNISATYAVFLVGALAMALRAGLPPLPGWQRILAAGVAAVLLVAVLLTQSRNALLAVLASVNEAPTVAPPMPASWSLGALALAAAIVAVSVPELRYFLFARNSYRPEIWWNAIDYITNRPLFGWGSYFPVNFRYGPGTGSIVHQAHNLFLSAWFRGGVGAAFALAAIFFTGIYWAARYWTAERRAAPLCMIVAVASLGVFDYQLLVHNNASWEMVTFWLPFGVCAGAEMHMRRRR
ncbi:MAG: O-antigen ligase family protein [Caldilineaceae bacterium]|nr:O-antigen ligase family protein [Caldilineaceae bacterium]